MSPNNKVNKNYNGQCSEQELITISRGQIWQIDKVIHTTTSSSECRQGRLGSKQSPSPWGIVQLAIEKKDVREIPRETHFLSNEEKEK